MLCSINVQQCAGGYAYAFRFFPAVKRVSVWKSTSPEIKMDMLKNREFEILNLPVNVPRIAIPRSINVKNFPVPSDNLTAEW